MWPSTLVAVPNPGSPHFHHFSCCLVHRTVCGVILLLCLIGTVLDMVSDCSKDIMLLINTSGRGDGLVSSAEGSEADNNFKSSSEVLIRDGDSGYFHSNTTPDLMAHAVKRKKNIASKHHVFSGVCCDCLDQGSTKIKISASLLAGPACTSVLLTWSYFEVH